MPTLGNPAGTLEILKKYNFNFQKRFGQNFLIDGNILNKIISSAGITRDDFVLEIGPGIGTMTQYLAESAREVVSVEIDRALIPILADTLSPYNNHYYQRRYPEGGHCRSCQRKKQQQTDQGRCQPSLLYYNPYHYGTF